MYRLFVQILWEAYFVYLSIPYAIGYIINQILQTNAQIIKLTSQSHEQLILQQLMNVKKTRRTHTNPQFQSVLKSSINSSSTHNVSVTQQRIKQCRICLQTQQDSKKQFIYPCRCSGSVKYVHQECMRSWLSVAIPKVKPELIMEIRREGYPCEMCGYRIPLEMELRTRCNDRHQLKAVIEHKTMPFVILVSCIALLLGAISFGTFAVASNAHLLKTGSLSLELILAICGVCLLLTFFLVTLYILVKDMLLQGYVVVGRVLSYQQVAQVDRSLGRVYPLNEDTSQAEMDVVRLE